MQPMNYIINTGNPANAFTQGAEQTLGLMGAVNQQRLLQQKEEAQRIANEQAIVRQQRFQEVALNPTATAVQRLMIEFPELSEQFKRSYDSLNDAEKEDAISTSYSVVSALKQGKADVAKAELDRKIEAAKNSGDAGRAQKYQMLRDGLVASPEGTLFGLQGLLFAGMGGEKYAQAVSALDANQRAQEKQPLDVRKLKAETIVKEVEAKFTPEKIKAEFGLMRAQTNQANASAASSQASAEASRATARRADAEAGQIRSGIIPADKRPEAEAKFRTEYNQRTAVFQDVQESYRRVEASKNDAAGDIALIFGYMKMLDPGSVVREGEFATASNAAGIPTQIQNLYNKALSGQRLSEGQRKMFKGQAQALYKAAGEKEQEVRSGITRIAKGYGLNTENIFYTPEPVATTQPPAPAIGSQLPGGFRVLGVER